MAIDYQALLDRPFAPVEHRFTARDSMLYALSLGVGSQAADPRQLPYVFEEGQRAFPTLPMVLGYPGFWAREADTGIDWRRLVHAEQSMIVHRPLPVAGTVIGHNRITRIIDKGRDKGALLYQERRVVEATTGELLATVNQVSLLRGDGGFGGPSGPVPAPYRLPERPADGVCDLPTLPQAALLYRLNGDYNPLHAEPAVARAAGFERPILHGLCTLGVAVHALLRSVLSYEDARVHGLGVRFSAPFYPGETLRTEFWVDGERVSFRCSALERGVMVLNAGHMTLSPG
ncbi:Acyl dehydratase [Pseudomonas flavescens]|uniref:Acyl dehydratase n=1 Tax=Phytopseudomonas flavescens TaxID=29435 RepID=A0A1G7Y416_9GAMM|nr:MaoC family dehydratase [Pseudomonas flavescens]SDG91202.1 Acyl dehydratase [Pseudomonas flavescens]